MTRRAQALVLEALAEGRVMVTAALSLAVARTGLGGETRELAWLIYDRDGPLSVLPLALGAMEVGTAASGAKTAEDLEVAQVIHEARAAPLRAEDHCERRRVRSGPDAPSTQALVGSPGRGRVVSLPGAAG